MYGNTPVGSGQAGIAVVGFGNAGRQHVAAIMAVGGTRLAGVVEIDPVAAGRASASGLPVRPLREVLEDDAVDLLALCVPPGGRSPITADALAAGKHLLVEKLPARCAAELGELMLAAKRAGCLAGVMFQHRFALPEPLRAGAPERFANAAAGLLVSRPRSRTHYRAGDWRSRPETAVGGVTAHLGVHYLDLACQLLGEPVTVRPLARMDAAPGCCGTLPTSLAPCCAGTGTGRGGRPPGAPRLTSGFAGTSRGCGTHGPPTLAGARCWNTAGSAQARTCAGCPP